MKRPLMGVLILHIWGIILGKNQAFLLFILLISSILLGFAFRPSTRKGLTFMGSFLLIGYVMASHQMSIISALGPFHEQSIKLKATVMQPPIEKENKTEILLKVQEAYGQDHRHKIEEKVVGNFYKNKDTLPIDIRPGDQIEFQGKVQIPAGMRNPGGFDYSLYLKTKNTYATIHILPDTLEKQGYHSPGILWNFIYTLKGHISQVIQQNLAPEHASLLKGILFGDKELQSHIRDSFVHSGIAHVLAVSGLHVGFLIAFVTYITKLFSIGPKGTLGVLTFFLLIYILLTGASPSVIRASIMAFTFLLSKVIRKGYDGISALALAGILVLLKNPLVLYTASFQLSFMAALSIIIFHPVISEILQKIKYIPRGLLDLLSVTLAAQIGTLPVSLYHFNQISLISIVTNLLIIPFLGIVLLVSLVAILSWMILPLVGEFLFFVSGMLFQWMITIALVFSSFKFSYIFIPPFKRYNILLYGIICLGGAGYIPLQRKRIKRFTLTLFILLILFNGLQYFWPKPLKVTYLDVGQGDSALVETPRGKNILIDGGGYPSFLETGREISEDVLLPAIYSKGIRAIDLAIVSHPHDDHIKGITELIGKVPIKAIGIYDVKNHAMVELLTSAKEYNIPVHCLAAGQSIQADKDVLMEVLSPRGAIPPGDGQKEINNYSLLIRMKYKDISYLFTGDIESDMEKSLVEKAVDVHATILKVAHHGSNTSSREEFIERVSPQICIISVGKNNNFGHPAPIVLDRLEEHTPHIYRTDEKGAIETTTKGRSIKIKTYLLK